MPPPTITYLGHLIFTNLVKTADCTLKFMECTRQVLQHIALQQDQEQRARFMVEVSVYDPSMLLRIDEWLWQTPQYVQMCVFIRGKPPRDHRLLSRGIRYSAIPIMSIEGVHDVCLPQGSVNGEKFKEFIRSCLLPILQPFNGVNVHSVVIMDNASIHHVVSLIW